MLLELAQRSLSELPLFALVAIGAHLVVSASQTLLHYGLGHHRVGGAFFRNHIRFHHTYYARGHLVSPNYRAEEGNNTPYFLIPTILVAGVMFFVLPLDLFLVVAAVSAASFYAHVHFDKAYHVEGSRLARFAWFRRKRDLHFVHHLHAGSNFAVIDFFWDRLLGTYRRPDGEADQKRHAATDFQKCGLMNHCLSHRSSDGPGPALPRGVPFSFPGNLTFGRGLAGLRLQIAAPWR